ncbi:MAG: hypothetical protein IK095_08495 [Oscillospiraceae bacterium]|nr:hypothetical protein [Oscillospiraceae bacterium]
MQKLDLESPYDSKLFAETMAILTDEELSEEERLDRAEEKLKSYFEYSFSFKPLFSMERDHDPWRTRGASEQESRVYAKLGEMSEGDEQERDEAFELQGVLGNECLRISMKERLGYIEERIRKFYEARGQGDGWGEDA